MVSHGVHELRRIREFLNSGPASSPLLVVDPAIVADRYRHMTDAFGDARIHYAVKANPERAVIRTLAGLGSCFEVASRPELDLCLDEGIAAERISYGSTIKKTLDIRYAFDQGVRLFAVDSEPELRKIADYAPGSRVYCRLLASGAGAQWPLSRKFGCCPEMAEELLAVAPGIGLHPVGLSFHTGSQQLEPKQWEECIRDAAEVAERLRGRGIELSMLNVGGGFPARYREPVPPIEAYAGVIRDAIDRHFRGGIANLVLEPGRSLVAEAGILRAEVVLVSHKRAGDQDRWVYLDVGRFGGLAETEGEAIRYPVVTAKDGTPDGPVVLAGPTCDSVDTLYQTTPYRLPLSLITGDHLDFLSAGAYTATYSSIGFNGFPPLQTVCLGG